MFCQSRIVGFGTVTLMDIKLILGIGFCQLYHQIVPAHLGQNGGSRNVHAEAVTLDNGSDRNILPKLRNATINGIPVSSEDFVRSLSLYGGDCCPGQYGYGYLNCNPGDEPAYEVSFTIQLMDIHEEAVVYTDTETITLRLDPEAKEGRYEKN